MTDNLQKTKNGKIVLVKKRNSCDNGIIYIVDNAFSAVVLSTNLFMY